MMRLLAIGFLLALAAHPVALSDEARLGINLNGTSDWNSELPFVDVFRQSRRWISQREGAGWGQGPPLELDERGWVRRLEPGCFAETLLCTIDAGRYPAGAYTVLYEGSGEIRFNRASIVEQQPGRMVLDVPPGGSGFFLQLRRTDPEDPVRNIRVIMPGFESTWRQQVFHPVFLERWRDMATIRFMDWMHTNNSKVRTWDDAPKVEDATWSQGVPVEVMVDLCNRLRIDPWFCMPHEADDDYVRRFAQEVRDRLDPGLKVYVEYSNEVWNSQFAQHQHAAERGLALGLADKPWEAAWRYYARRSVEIFSIWEQAMGGSDRLVRVLAAQSANSYVAKQILAFEDAAGHADALATAPYFGFSIPPKDAATWRDAGVEAVLDHIEQVTLPQTIEHIREHRRLADEHGLSLIAYEAGQHLVGIGGAENDEALTRVLHAANRHPRMGELYRVYYDAWAEAGGGVMAVFSSIGAWSKWGSWGLMEHYDDDPADYPKMQATLRWMQGRSGAAAPSP